MFHLANHPQSIGKVLDNTFGLYAACFKSTFVLAFFTVLASVLPTMVMQQNVAADPVDFAEMGMGKFMGAYLTGMLICLMLYNALFYKVNSVARNETVGYGQAVGVGLRKLFPMIIAVILYMLVVGVGLVLLVVPGLILMLSLILYGPLIICDDEGPVSALNTSHRLVWGNWWRTITVFLAPFFIYMVIYMGVGMILGFVIGVKAASGGGDGANLVGTASLYMNLFTIVMGVIAYPFFASLFIVQLNDLKLRKSGADLDARIAG